MIKTSLPRKNNSFVYGLHNILRVKYEVGHIQLFDKGKVNNLSPQFSTVGSSFIRQAVAYTGRRRNLFPCDDAKICLSKPSERSVRCLGIRNEQNEWGGNVHVRGGG